MLHIASIDFRIEEKGVFNTGINSKETLLDSDVVIVNPLGVSKVLQLSLMKHSENQIMRSDYNVYSERLDSLSREIKTLLSKGKLVVCFLSPVEKYTSVNNFHVENEISNYDFLPYELADIKYGIQTGKGAGFGNLSLGSKRTMFDGLFHSLKQNFKYEAYIDRDRRTENHPEENFIFNRAEKPVGAIRRYGDGAIVFLPQLEEKNDSILISAICQTAKSFFRKEEFTSEPEWVNEFTLPGEPELLHEINEFRQRINDLKEKEKNLLASLKKVKSFKGLLYETGGKLEDIVKEAFSLLGFEVTNRDTGSEEHDILFSSTEGRGIAEVEGKGNSWINVGKMDQLSRAVDEDFDINGSYAQGVLIGNHFRLLEPKDRKEAFTVKAKTVAERKRFALLNTVQLYSAVEYILNNPEDDLFKETARKAILNTEGEEVDFQMLLKGSPET